MTCFGHSISTRRLAIEAYRSILGEIGDVIGARGTEQRPGSQLATVIDLLRIFHASPGYIIAELGKAGGSAAMCDEPFASLHLNLGVIPFRQVDLSRDKKYHHPLWSTSDLHLSPTTSIRPKT